MNIERMLDDAKKHGAAYFDISGGDPLILDKFVVLETVKYSSKMGLSTSISTNASNLSAEYMEELAAAGLEKIKFSLYGGIAETHDDFTRTPGSFERVIDGIRISRAAGIEVWVNAVVTPDNMDEIQGLSPLLEPLDVDLVQLTSIVPCGRGETVSGYRFSEDELGNAIKALESGLSDLEHAFTITLFPDPRNPPFAGRFCDYFDERLVVDPDGSIVPCCLLPAELQHRLGNISEGIAEVCSDFRIGEDAVFYWLAQGHQAMRRELGYEDVSHNLCATCIDMLSLLSEADKRGSPS
jgi:MoaA/NifB/PqqE/SkfB family radical SAM enzyme